MKLIEGGGMAIGDFLSVAPSIMDVFVSAVPFDV